MSQNPTYFCARCHTTRPPLFAVHTYTCVMCGKQRTVAEYKREMEKLRSESPASYVGPTPKLEVPRSSASASKPSPSSRPRPQKAAPVTTAAAPPTDVPSKTTIAKAAPAKSSPIPKATPAPKRVTKPKAAAAAAAAKPAPKAAAKPAPKAAASEELSPCEWHECENKARARSKYCSRACSNKNARHRHAQRRTN